ncbi:MAG: hypothetical protein C0501_29335 [Isosphaera sp.]|nr:hypothetical protein [Isosphaera sp.]
MNRTVLALAACLAPAPARAEILPTFSSGRSETEASHVVVADDTGKVLESWRGDLKPGDVLPLPGFRLRLEQPVGGLARQLGGKPDGGPDKVTGKRLVLFLRKGGPKYDRGQVVGSWSAAHFTGQFDVSTLWVEDGQAFGLEQWINPGPQEMTRLGTEAEFKAGVARLNETVRGLIAKARAAEKPADRAKILAGVVTGSPGFAAEAFAGLEWCGPAAVPALRTILAKDLVGEPEVVGALSVMAKLGPAARDDLVKHLAAQLAAWKDLPDWATRPAGLEPHEAGAHRQLLAATGNPDAFRGTTADQRKVLRDLRDVWARHPVLSKVGEAGDRVHDRLDHALDRSK